MLLLVARVCHDCDVVREDLHGLLELDGRAGCNCAIGRLMVQGLGRLRLGEASHYFPVL